MKSLFPNASLRQFRWPSVRPANVQRRQKLFWVIARVLGSIHHVQNKGSVHVHKPVDGFSWCRNALPFFFFLPRLRSCLSEQISNAISATSKTNHGVCLPQTWKQPSNVRSFISRRHRWCFTALCWTRAENYKKLQLPLKIPKLNLIPPPPPFFFSCIKPHLFLLRPLWRVCPQDARAFEEWSFYTEHACMCASPAALWVPLLPADSRTTLTAIYPSTGWFLDSKHPNRFFPPTVMYTLIRL